MSAMYAFIFCGCAREFISTPACFLHGSEEASPTCNFRLLPFLFWSFEEKNIGGASGGNGKGNLDLWIKFSSSSSLTVCLWIFTFLLHKLLKIRERYLQHFFFLFKIFIPFPYLFLLSYSSTSVWNYWKVRASEQTQRSSSFFCYML